MSTKQKKIVVKDHNPYQKFVFVRKLGEGGFGSVRLYANGGQQVAIKRYPRDKNGRMEFDFEIKAFERIGNHKHIVKFLAAFDVNEGLCIALEFCKMGDLDRIYSDHDRYSEQDVRDIAIQICEALEHMRLRAAVHRDIKPGNILVRSWSPINVAVADLNFAKLASKKRANHLTVFRTDLGTSTYKAPEVSDKELRKNEKTYNHKCDAWSLGIVLFQLLSGRNDPFVCSEDQFRQILSECDTFAEFKYEIVVANKSVYEAGEPQFQPEEAWEIVSDEGRHCVEMLLQRNYEDRWEFSDVLGSGWAQKKFADTTKLFDRAAFDQRNEDLKKQFATYADFDLY